LHEEASRYYEDITSGPDKLPGSWILTSSKGIRHTCTWDSNRTGMVL